MRENEQVHRRAAMERNEKNAVQVYYVTIEIAINIVYYLGYFQGSIGRSPNKESYQK